MCPKIWISSLQLGVKFSTKRLKTCQAPTLTMPRKIAATNSSMERSIAANIRFTASRIAALLLRQNLFQQMLCLQLGGELLLHTGRSLARFGHVGARDDHAALLQLGHAFGVAYRRHAA